MKRQSMAVFAGVLALTVWNSSFCKAADMGAIPMEKNISGQGVAIPQSAQVAIGAKTSGLSGSAASSNGQKTTLPAAIAGEGSVKDMFLGQNGPGQKAVQQKPEGKVRYRVAGREAVAEQKSERPKRVFNNLD
jgi:hypothetical protein